MTDSKRDELPPEPELTKPMSLNDAYHHLYQLEPFEWEDEAAYAARKIAREDFERQLAAEGLTIQALVSMGQIQPILDRTIAKPLSLTERLIKRL